MKKRVYCGLMSGSSLDGLDIAVVKFYSSEKNVVEKHKLLYSNTIPFPEDLKAQLRGALDLNVKEFLHLENIFSRWCGLVIKTLPPKIYKQIDKIATHGHTILHHPEINLTYQMCNGWELAKTAQKSVTYDFRRNDIAYNGQGAPLAPLVEKYLFPEHKIFINLGGIANISIHGEDEIIAYDICPFNQVLNALAETQGHDYDKGGEMAEKGAFLNELVENINKHEFFTLSPPKSLDNSWIKNIFLPAILEFDAKVEDKLHTLTHWMAEQIFREIEKYTSIAVSNKIVITGGGYWNTYFIKILNNNLQIPEYAGIKQLDNTIIDSKEAILMALLGLLRDNNIPNSLAMVTGAEKDTLNGIKISYKAK